MAVLQPIFLPSKFTEEAVTGKHEYQRLNGAGGMHVGNESAEIYVEHPCPNKDNVH